MEEELNLGRYLAILRRHWLALFVGVFVGGAAGVVSASLRPVLYEGVTTILILRKMSRRFRERDVPESEVPYGPSPAPSAVEHDDESVSVP